MNRCYSLCSREDRVAVGAMTAIFVVGGLAGAVVQFYHRGAMAALMGLALAVVPILMIRWSLTHVIRSRTLHITEQGLILSASWEKPISIAWDDIRGVSLEEGRLSFSRSRSTCIVIRDRTGQTMGIPGSIPDSAEIRSLLRERVPHEQWETGSVTRRSSCHDN